MKRMNAVETPQTRCRAGITRRDITPPAGIYHRMWGAAKHERATGVHRPLLATVLWLEPEAGGKSEAIVVATLDHCLFDEADIARMRAAIVAAAGVAIDQVLIAVSHTHAAGLMSRTRALLPGGEFIGPYLDGLAGKLAELSVAAAAACQSAAIVYGAGRCSLAANRDFFDMEAGKFVCGFNPAGPADDTVIVAKITSDDGQTIGAIVNYACHATTLAWQNTLISPDYVGALRDTVESQMKAPCVFLQGASADLGPREGFVGDTAIADRNGRQLGYSALAAIESLPMPGTRYAYSGPVVSGATIGTWRHESASVDNRKRQTAWKFVHWNVELAYRDDLPTIAAAEAELTSWQTREQKAIAAGDAEQAQECHARVEQAQRQVWRLQSLPQPRFLLPITMGHLGDAIWLFVAGEHYQHLQTSLRNRFPNQPIIISTITNGWQPGYIPPAEIYGRGIYQEQIAVVAPGSAERLLAAIAERELWR
jgi:hypothetical protein